MEKSFVPWKQIIQFHREIAIRSEESFFSFELDDTGSESFSYITDEAIYKMQVNPFVSSSCFSNQLIFANVDKKNTEYYIGGILWYVNRKVNNQWIKIAFPLLYKPFDVKKEDHNNRYNIEPEQAKWDISPMFYKLIDKKGIVFEENIEDVVRELLEEANIKSNEKNFVDTFISLFVSKFPELKGEFVEKAPQVQKSQWLIFVAPKDFSTIQRNLILDYSKLISKLEENDKILGGFQLFEKQRMTKYKELSVTPIVPLNDNQLKVVQKVISGNEITVVSGPPGCGKSQVVISMLLNAWDKGQSVLFASSNNQAVDVVRERMQQFETRVPMVVRCGARQTSELMTTIEKITAVIDNYEENTYCKKNEQQIELLKDDLEALTKLLDSNLPQRIEELAKSALGAYAKAGDYKESREAERELYEEKLKKHFIVCGIEEYVQTVYKSYVKWMEAHDEMLYQIKQDNEKRNQITEKIHTFTEQVIDELKTDYDNPSAERFISKIKLDEIYSWYVEYKEFLLQFIESELQEIEWLADYERWSDEQEATEWIDESTRVLSFYGRLTDKYSSYIAEINEKQERLRLAQEILRKNEIKSINATKQEALNKWIIAYNAYIMLPKKMGDFLPFSQKFKLEKELTKYETIIIDSFNGKYRSEYAQDPVKRREFISTHAEAMFEEYSANCAIVDIVEKINVIQNEQKALNKMLSAIGVQEIQNLLDGVACKECMDEVKAYQKVAKEAKIAYSKIERRKSIIKKEREYRHKGRQILYAIMNEIKADTDLSEFVNLLNGDIDDELSVEFLRDARRIMYKHSIDSYLGRLEKVCSLWDEIDKANKEMANLNRQETLKNKWVKACPNSIKALFSYMSYEGTIQRLREVQEEFKEIYNTWINEGQEVISRLREAEEQEYAWALESICKALELCPDSVLSESRESILKYIKEQKWDVAYIRKLFSKISHEGIAIKQARLKSALEDLLLTNAISTRMNELNDADEVKAALSKLYIEYRRTHEVITESAEKDFVTALKALPLWITTGQSPQAIPMLPNIFDLLIIDEATQCTITSILPLIYRCKKIVVIGDMNQLPAIDNISMSAEKYMADKFSVEDYLYLLGHCGCNIYKSVLNMIPVKEGNVISLTDHYRSHPLIIGFSNYYVYKNKLVLKKRMKEIGDNKFSGVFGINVTGEAYRDTRTDSWCNAKEADRVIELIRSFKSIKEYSNFTIGVITPFRGQVNLIYEKLERINDITNVLVSTVHKYQGDEKDIIIFSPVVSKSMTPGAARWVENPQNLINVAVTRAREAFYVVSDFEVCRRQPGILGHLIKYTEKIELLRKTSPYELQLFGLMILEGWNIDVHPTIKDIEVDFIVSYLGCKVVVEVDGRQHDKQKLMDQNRDAMLASNGYDVIRITTREIADTPFETIEKIREYLQSNIF